jgi:hypothetical protein
MGASISFAAQMAYVVQCEDFNSSSGLSFPASAYSFKAIDELVGVRQCGNGKWLEYDSVPFNNGEYDSVRLYLWSNWANNTTNAAIKFRTDSPTGTVFATLTTIPYCQNGYPWAAPYAGAPMTAKVTGVHNVYITFEGSSNICDVDCFWLTGTFAFDAQNAKVYHVSAGTGSDAFDGLSADRPFKTIQKAATIMKPGDRCLIGQGIYRETIRPYYSGTVGAPVRFEAEAGANVVVSGADPVTGWSLHSGNIYKAQMNWTRGGYYDQVLVDGTIAWTARCPDVIDRYVPDPNDWGLPLCGGVGGPQDWSAWRNQAEPMAIPSNVCIDFPGTFQNVDGNFPPFDMVIKDNSSTDPKYRLPAAFFNHPANFFAGGILQWGNYYWASIALITGSSSTASQTTLNCACGSWNSMVSDFRGPGWVSHVLGLLDSPNEWYRDSVTRTLYLWAPDNGNPSNHLVEAKRRTLGLDLRGRGYVTVTGLHFLATGASLADAANCIVDGCVFKYPSYADVFKWYETAASYFQPPWNPSDGANGIYISGSNNIIRKCVINGSSFSGVVLGGKYNTVTNNYIRNCNFLNSYNAGVLVMKRSWSDTVNEGIGLSISHNTIRFCPRAGVQTVKYSPVHTAAERLQIAYNDIALCCYGDKETGLISISGVSGPEISYNWLHGVAGTEQSGVTVEGDMGGGGHIVHHNVIWQGESMDRSEKYVGNWIGPGGSTTMIFNNTIIDPMMPLHRDVNIAAWNGFKPNNIIAEGDTAPWKFADPLNRHYWLTAASKKAIDSGVVVPGYVTTFVGNAPDLGAYEYGQTPWTAGADWQEQPWIYPPSAAAISLPPIAGVNAVAAPRLRMSRGMLLIAAPARMGGTMALIGPSGRVVKVSRLLAAGATIVDIRDVPRGTYVVRCAVGARAFVWKIMHE